MRVGSEAEGYRVGPAGTFAAVAGGYFVLSAIILIFSMEFGTAAIAFSIFFVPWIGAITLPFSLIIVFLLSRFEIRQKWVWVSIGGLFPALYFVTIDAWDFVKWSIEAVQYPRPTIAERLQYSLYVGLLTSPAGLIGGLILWRLFVSPTRQSET